MKKLLLSIVAITVGFYSYGQGISGGIKAGTNLANLKFTTDVGFVPDTKVRPGIHGGVFIVAMITEKFGVQPEVLFSMQGAKWDVSGDDSKLKFNYVSIPVLFRYNITDMISVHAGPQLGILTSAEVEYEDGDTEDLKDDLKGMDFGGAAGAEIDLPMGLGFGARYVLGFTNNADGDDFEDIEIKNRMFQIYVKYVLFGKK